MSNLSKLLLLLFFLAGFVWLWSHLPIGDWVELFRVWIIELGVVGVAVFILAYVLLTVLMAPVSLLTLSAGLAYGAWGFPLVVVAATLAATVAFLVGRYVAQERVALWINKDPKLKAINAAASNEGWRVVGLLRLSPLVPFGIQNYLLSITNIRLAPFIIATAFGMLPGIGLFVYIGAVGQTFGSAGTLQWMLIAVGLISTGLIVWFVGKRANAMLVKNSTVELDS